jgi:hypothetical protein
VEIIGMDDRFRVNLTHVPPSSCRSLFRRGEDISGINAVAVENMSQDWRPIELAPSHGPADCAIAEAQVNFLLK